jgi:NTE family protein
MAGGGAYGFAEIGAVEWLEEHRVPIDGIAGTSGGALLGGWYATGLDLLTDEEVAHPPIRRGPGDMRLRGISEVMGTVDIESMFRALPRYGDLSQSERADRREFPSELLFGIVQGRVRASDGLLPGQAIGLLLDRITARYPASYLYGGGTAPFDRLPTPYRCVACNAQGWDYTTWKPVVLGGTDQLPLAPGYEISLAQAMRASMAIPLAFSPVYAPDLQRPGQSVPYSLVDGGVVDNYPTDVAEKEFEPDAVIGLEVGQLGLGPLDMLLQATGHAAIPSDVADASMAWKRANNPVPGLLPISVQLDSGGFEPDRFDRWRQLAWIGYRSMQRAYETRYRSALDKLMLGLPEYLQFRRDRRARRSAATLIPRSIRPDSRVASSLQQLQREVVGHSIDDEATRTRMERTLDRLAASPRYSAIGYQMDKDALTIQPSMRAYGPPLIFSKETLDLGSRDRSWYGVSALESDPVGPRGRSTWKTQGTLGPEISFGSSLEYHLNEGPAFVRPWIGYALSREFAFSGDQRSSGIAPQTARAGMDLGYELGRDARVSFDTSYCHLESGSTTGAALPAQSGNFQALGLSLRADTTDSPTLPAHGILVEGALRDLAGFPGAAAFLPQAELRAASFGSGQGGALRLFGRIGAGTSFGDRDPFLAQFKLGGFGNMDAAVRNRYSDNGYAYGSLGTLYRVYKLPDFFGRCYLGDWLETATIEGRWIEDVTLGLATDTRLGPFFLGASVGDRGATRFLLEIGLPLASPSTRRDGLSVLSGDSPLRE